jgi:hypothetical protein
MSALFHLDRSIPFVDTIFGILEGTASDASAIQLLRKTEQKHQIQLIMPTRPDIPHAPDDVYDRFIRQNFFAFLSDTQLVLGAFEYDNITLLLPDTTQWTATFRAWGQRSPSGPIATDG